MIIWWSLFLNLVALETKNTILIFIVWSDSSVGALANYALGSIACFFFSNAIMVQVFEWDMIAAMIRFQAQRHIIKLNVDRDKFKNEERIKLKCCCYTVWFNVIYHIVKAGIPTSTLIACAYFNESQSNCTTTTNHRI